MLIVAFGTNMVPIVAADPQSLAVLKMPPDMVIRSAGTWDTRTPFDSYLRAMKEVNRRYALAELAAQKTKRSLAAVSEDQVPVRTYFVRRQGRSRRQRPAEGKPWGAYRRAFGRDETGSWIRPSMDDVMEDLDGVLLLAREGTIIRHISVFESFLQCWSLNFLLARLETGMEWAPGERTVAQRLSPVHRPSVPLGVVATLRFFSEAHQMLENLPPFFKHPITRLVVTEPGDVGLSAREVLEFWIALRNLLVHRDGWVSAHFIGRHGEVWDKLFASYSHIKTLRPGSPLPLFHDMVSSLSLTVYRSCLALNELLEKASAGRRGVVAVPSADMATKVKRRATLLLIEGDHDPSLRWTSDAAFRERLVPGLASA